MTTPEHTELDLAEQATTITVRPLRMHGAPRDNLGPFDLRDISLAEFARDAGHYPERLAVAQYPDGRRVVLVSLSGIGLRRLPAPEVSRFVGGAPDVPPGDWVTLWEGSTDPLALAAHLDYLPPMATLRAAHDVARLAMLTIDGSDGVLYRNLSTALYAVQRFMQGALSDASLSQVRHGMDTVANALEEQHAEEQHAEEQHAEKHRPRAARAVYSAVSLANLAWAVGGGIHRKHALQATIERTLGALDADPRYASERTARMAAMLTPEGRHPPPAHPEVLAALRGAIGDEVYTSLPSAPVRL